jgi:hypothetical protein
MDTHTFAQIIMTQGDGLEREDCVWYADLLMDVDMWWGSCEVCVVQIGALFPRKKQVCRWWREFVCPYDAISFVYVERYVKLSV